MNENASKETLREVEKYKFAKDLSGEIKLARDAAPANSRNPATIPRGIRGTKSANSRVSRKYLPKALNILPSIFSVNQNFTLR